MPATPENKPDRDSARSTDPGVETPAVAPATRPGSAPDKRRLAAQGYGRLSVLLLYFLGAYILLAPWVAPRFLGWEAITRAVGGEQVFLRLAVGLLFIYFATSTHEKYKLKFLTQDILHAFNMLLYGRDYRQHRAAVSAQIARLASEDPTVRKAAHRALVRMTGQAFPAEVEPWMLWWKQARHTFRLADATDSRSGGATPGRNVTPEKVRENRE
jgi:hypothetical protein